MPVHHHVDDRHLVEQGALQLLGLQHAGLLRPRPRATLATGIPQDAVQQFKMMVRDLHAAGIEVILDVVYNHTAEGNQLGPTLSFRGIDNAAYYRLSPEDPRYYMDFTGCGNTLNMQHPRVLQLIMDSLRYWVTEMHVDGFRFDLASTLARELLRRQQAGRLLRHHPPGPGPVAGQADRRAVGRGRRAATRSATSPCCWTEWNGKYRDSVRRFWKGDGGTVVASSPPGSAAAATSTQDDGRQPYASINFITCHDGFTLHDLVSYNDKHNEANGEDNRDGANDNNSWNCGAEGPTDDPTINALARAAEAQLPRHAAALAGRADDPAAATSSSHTQKGNNNAYCQDNELTWLNWELDDEQQGVPRLRRRRRSASGRSSRSSSGASSSRAGAIRGSDIKDISWFEPRGKEMTDEDWNAGFVKCLGVRLAGDLIGDVDERGEPIVGDTLLLLLNAHHEPIPFTLPHDQGRSSTGNGCSTRPTRARPRAVGGGEKYPLKDRSLAVLRPRAGPRSEAMPPGHAGGDAAQGEAAAAAGDGRTPWTMSWRCRLRLRRINPWTRAPMTTELAHRRARTAAGEIARRSAPAPARVDLPPAVPHRLHLPRCRRDRALPARPGHHATATPRPTCKARPGSTHGYDIIDHQLLNPEIGTDEDYDAWSRPCTRTAWARSSTRSPTTWASSATTTPGGTTCWRTAPRRPTPLSSTSTGTRRRGRSCTTRSSCPSSATPTARCWSRADPPRLRGRRLYAPLFRPSLSRRPLQLRADPRPSARRAEGRAAARRAAAASNTRAS